MEEFRLQYPLDSDSLVLDAGAYRGDFIDWCRKRWGCEVIAFEPCSEFADGVQERFEGDRKVRVLRCGVSGKTESVPIAVRGDSTSAFALDVGSPAETVTLLDVVDALDLVGRPQVDLFKINIEGGEYPLLERMIEKDLLRRVRFFQIQFHGIGSDEPGPARDRIRAALNRTHFEEWCVNGGQWESWARRG